uniref:NADH-ubiquinone oxidoreductase chain 2 n=1 Tax=Melanophila acuminata TaxID=1483931 RepID=A0A7U0M885_9COLE|nr:NADH dehydrogenase subunit 2 [Melanophila acuminata]QQX28196.1 NADH dehydrogenase subunit 2 [Melanophila acuminata]
MINFYKIMFFFSLISGTLISISSYSWLGMWVGLEINLLSIIPLMNNSKNLFSSEASLKYFITQALASSILLFSIILLMSMDNFINNMNLNNLNIIIMNSALLTKTGAAPFHFWFPEVMEGLNWMNSLILLTWQKLAPMILLMYNLNMTTFFTIIIIMCLTVGSIMGLNQISLRKILAYSSINHIGWMIAAMMFLELIWLYYFIIYTIISLNIILIFNYFKIFFIKQLFSSFNQNPSLKMMFSFNFFSLGGLPPFLGFFPKWLTIQMLVQNKFYFLTFTMIIMTLITLYYYIRISFSSLLLNNSELNFKLDPFLPTKNFYIFLFNFISLLSLIFCTIVFNWL